jgi:hypothetical protein
MTSQSSNSGIVRLRHTGGCLQRVGVGAVIISAGQHLRSGAPPGQDRRSAYRWLAVDPGHERQDFRLLGLELSLGEDALGFATPSGGGDAGNPAAEDADTRQRQVNDKARGAIPCDRKRMRSPSPARQASRYAEFDDCAITTGPDTTILRAQVPDQGALMELVQRINGLGLEVVDLDLVTAPPE